MFTIKSFDIVFAVGKELSLRFCSMRIRDRLLCCDHFISLARWVSFVLFYYLLLSIVDSCLVTRFFSSKVTTEVLTLLVRQDLNYGLLNASRLF